MRVWLVCALLAACVLVPTGCSRPKATAGDLVGKWRGVPRDIGDVVAAADQNMRMLPETVRDDFMQKLRKGAGLNWEFREDHSAVFSGASRDVPGTWQLQRSQGNTLFIEFSQEGFSWVGKLTFQGKDAFTLEPAEKEEDEGVLIFARVR
jgi:hypothetical protein